MARIPVIDKDIFETFAAVCRLSASMLQESQAGLII